MKDMSLLLWEEYSARNLERCVIQAGTLEKQITELTTGATRTLSPFFMSFDDSKDNIQKLAGHLSDEYRTKVYESEDRTYWVVWCTTDPVPIDIILQQYSIEWVTEMCKLTESFGCTFSSWQFRDMGTSGYWSNSEGVARDAG